jgi:hypothetical protein
VGAGGLDVGGDQLEALDGARRVSTSPVPMAIEQAEPGGSAGPPASVVDPGVVVDGEADLLAVEAALWPEPRTQARRKGWHSLVAVRLVGPLGSAAIGRHLSLRG